METALRRDLAQYLGHVVPVTFDPALLVLSYIISLVGAASTLELIHRRTSRRGYYNNLLLLGASITMGGVAIWSMHYIGNRATTLADGEPELQIAYSVGVTVASFFVPIFVLLVAFFVVTGTATSSNQISWWRVCASGTLSGAAICGMHYLGNASISNYRCSYLPAFVGASVVIAAVASTVALTLFFVFRSAWTNSWWKRIGCAVVLAGAVSGMHWCAVMGTRYSLTRVTSYADTSSRNTTVIVTAVLSFVACLIMAGLAGYSARVRKGYANRAQRITLAAAVFDESGRLLVTPDGFLPSEVVTSTFLQKTQNETFSTAHPLFHWLFRASRSWDSLSTLLAKMNQHLARLPHHGRNVRTGIELVDKEGHVIDNYDTIFCELFCVAASALANQMNEDLVDAGVLWDEILATGGHDPTGSTSQTPSITQSRSRGSEPSLKHNLDDLAEKGATENKRGGEAHGHLMFLVRKVDSSHVDHLAAAGYFFAEPRQVAHIIRSKMQIRTGKLEEKLKGMDRYARGTMLEPGVHVGLFAVRTQVHQTGFDVLARRQARNLLPTVELPLDRLEPAHLEFLRRLDGMSLGALLRRLEHANELPARDASFAGMLLDALRNLRASVQDPAFDNSKLVAKVSQAPCAPPAHEARPSTCSLIAFTIMIPIHVRVDAPAYEFVPLPFFKAQQLVYKNSPHNAAFARSVHRNMSPVLDAVSAEGAVLPTSRLREIISAPGILLFSRSGPSSSHMHTPGHHHHLRPRRNDAVKLVSPSREHMAPTPCDESVSSLTLYGGSGEPELSPPPPDRKPHNGGGGPGADAGATRPGRRQPQPQQQQGSKMSFGGIMISQEVTVDVEEAADDMPEMPPSTHLRDSSHGGTGAGAARHHHNHSQQSGGDHGVGQDPAARHEQAIELKDVSTVLGMGVSKVEVRKEGDDAVTTFVDDLFSACIDTPRRV